ncbi:MAG: transporter substrate-binding domain-containing protein [Candidatus Cloacimonetes bacterium]|nr:transporter substrate-binding domain-containing protein [Candidatus Cloacimonadota bacterium]
MTKNFLKLFFTMTMLLSVMFICADQTPLQAVKDTISIASEPDYPPYCFVDENGEAAGFSIDLFLSAAKAAGLDVNIKIGIWEQIKQDLAEGKVDALPFVGRTPERENLYDFTMPYLSLHGAVFVLKGTKDINSLNDLKEKSIVLMKGDNAEEFVRRENISDNIVTTATFEEAFITLANGEYDAVITQRVMGIELLKKIGIKNIIPLDFHIPQYRQDFCFAVQKGDMQLLNRLNEGLSIVIANDTFENIRNKWFGPSIKEKISFSHILRYLLFILIPVLIIIAVGNIFLLRREVRNKTRVLNNEIIQHKSTLKDLKINEEKYHGMIMNLLEGFYSVTLDGILIDYNNEFTNILNLEPDNDYTGKNLPDFWQNPKEREIYVNEILQNGIIKNYEIKAKKADGAEIVVMVNSRIIKDNTGNPIRIEGTFLDVTERKHALEELQKMKDKLENTVAKRTAQLQEKVEKLSKSEKAMLYIIEDLNNITAELHEERRKLVDSNEELEAFAYSVSHDLRAPLRAIDGFGKFLFNDYAEKLDAEGKRFINVIRTNAAKMDKLILDLLNLSRIFRSDIAKTEVDMGAVAESIYLEIADDQEKKQFKMKIKEIPNAFCDITLIKQVWQNLISNSLKYSSKSEIKKIEIGATENKKEIIYYIKDHGVGFDNKYIDKLFKVFQRLHKEDEFEGTGVGLAIVKRIIKRHGGKVWAEGKVDEGATFYFSLPKQENPGD